MGYFAYVEKLVWHYGLSLPRQPFLWIKSFYRGYLIMDDFQLKKLCSPRQMNLKQFKFFCNHGSSRELGPSSSRTHGSWCKWMFFIHILQTFFQTFIQYVLFIHDMQTFFQLFIHITQHYISIFHCEMLCYINENYIMDESWKQMMAWYQWKVAQWMKSWKIIATRPTFAHFLLATWLGFSSPHSLNKLQLLMFMDHN